jgi:hypothetical protein
MSRAAVRQDGASRRGNRKTVEPQGCPRKDRAVKATLGRQFVVPVALLALTATGCATDHTGQTAAHVGQEQVTTAALTSYMEELVKEQTAPVSGAARLAWQRSVLGYLIERDIFSTIAARSGVSVSEADITSTVTALGGDAAVDKQLVTNHLPSSIKHTLLESLTLENKLIDKWLPVSDADLQAAYQQEIATFQQVNVTFVTATSQAQAEQIATKLRAAPTTFDAIATATLGAGNAPAATGLQPKGQFGATLGDQLWAAKVGDVLAVNAQGAWRVLLVTDHVLQSFEAAKPQLLATARNGKTQAVVTDNITKLQATDPIVVNPRFGRWDPAQQLVVDATTDTVKQNDSVSVTDPLGTGATGGTGGTGGTTPSDGSSSDPSGSPAAP